MKQPANLLLIGSGVAAITGGIVHLLAIAIGPSWYRFIGAPEAIVRLAAAGHPYPAIVCVLIAAVLFLWAAYAFSGGGVMRRLPLLRTGLVVIATLLIVRGIAFIPLMLWHPAMFTGICNCQGVDGFLITTSAMCLAAGIGYAVGTRRAWCYLSPRQSLQ